MPRRRVVAAVLVASLVLAMRHARDVTGDLGFFVGVSRHLTSSRGLLVYADNENAQSGPLSLLAVRAIDWIWIGAFPFVIVALGKLTLYACRAGG